MSTSRTIWLFIFDDLSMRTVTELARPNGLTGEDLRGIKEQTHSIVHMDLTSGLAYEISATGEMTAIDEIEDPDEPLRNIPPDTLASSDAEADEEPVNPAHGTSPDEEEPVDPEDVDPDEDEEPNTVATQEHLEERAADGGADDSN